MTRKLPFPLILASKSPRRQFLLKQAGFDFQVEERDTDETVSIEIDPKDIPTYLAEKKAEPFLNLSDTHIIVAADTIVLLDDEILGKPSNFNDAFRMLKKLSGRHHIVITGITILHNNVYHTFREVTNVYFRSLVENEIKEYITDYGPYDKAGAYGVQEGIGLWAVSRVEGDFYNVMGFPVCRFLTELNNMYHNMGWDQ